MSAMSKGSKRYEKLISPGRSAEKKGSSDDEAIRCVSCQLSWCEPLFRQSANKEPSTGALCNSLCQRLFRHAAIMKKRKKFASLVFSIYWTWSALFRVRGGTWRSARRRGKSFSAFLIFPIGTEGGKTRMRGGKFLFFREMLFPSWSTTSAGICT